MEDAGMHPGVRIRISTPAGVVFEADSVMMHYQARFGGPSACLPYCLPGCRAHGWSELLTWEQMTIEIRPVMLSDPRDDDDGD